MEMSIVELIEFHEALADEAERQRKEVERIRGK
jgi:hypothetical protein